MAKDIKIPDYLKGLVDQTQMQSEYLISSADSVPRISLRGGKFRFIEDGEEVERVSDEIHLIILGVQPERAMAKTFYLGKYSRDDTAPPDCSSSNGITPDPWVSNRQSEKCMGCPQNVWGSAVSMSGGKAKACRDSKRLMVVKATGISGVIYILNVTISSLKNLSAYGKILVENSVPMAAAITTVSFDGDSDFPKIQFEFMGCLKEKLGVKALARSGKREWESLSQEALTHDRDGEDVKRISQDEDEDEEEEEETEKERVARLKKEIGEAEKKAQEEHEDEDEDEEEGDTVRVKRAKKKKAIAAKKKKEAEEEDDDDDSSPMSDVDDLLDGWEED